MIKTLLTSAVLALVTMPAVAGVRFYCDIDQGYTCSNDGRCAPVAQTVHPARYRFELDPATNRGVFRSCPGDECGIPFPVKVVSNAEGMIAIYERSPEVFVFSRDLSTYTYRWPSNGPGDTEGRHHGRCTRVPS